MLGVKDWNLDKTVATAHARPPHRLASGKWDFFSVGQGSSEQIDADGLLTQLRQCPPHCILWVEAVTAHADARGGDITPPVRSVKGFGAMFFKITMYGSCLLSAFYVPGTVLNALPRRSHLKFNSMEYVLLGP